jgi:IS1 family transposase
MNKLPLKTRVQILEMLCEGSSMRSISRLAHVSINTVSKLLVDAGTYCAALHDREIRNVKSASVQCDEIWSFAGVKTANSLASEQPGAGDVWTWTALDSDSKLIVSWLVGSRDYEHALAFMEDVRSRLANRVQLTTDGRKAHLKVVEEASGADSDFETLVRKYGEPEGNTASQRRSRIEGKQHPAHGSAPSAGRASLSLRMADHRFTGMTKALSNKLDNYTQMVALFTVWHNMIRVHQMMRMSPAMAAGVSDRLWSMQNICEGLDAGRPQTGPKIQYRT